MSLKRNQFINKNSQKDATGGYSSSRANRKSNSTTRRAKSKFNFNHSKLSKVIGLICLLFSLYFLIAFTSYLFTWKDDQSYVSSSNGGWSNLFKTSEELEILGFDEPVVDNWLGKFGALLSHQFIYKWFGIASFIFIAILFILGYRLLFKVLIYPLNKTLAYSIFFLLFISTTIAYFHGFGSNSPHFIEGEIGFWSNRLLQAQIGNAGVGVLLLFTILVFLVIVYNLDFKFEKNTANYKNEDDENTIQNKPIRVRDELKSQEINLSPRINETNEVLKRDKKEEPSFEVEHREESTLTNSYKKPEVKSPETTMDTDEAKPIPSLSIEAVAEEKKADSNVLVEKYGKYDPKLDLSSYKYPHLGLLREHGSGKITINSQELEANKDRIVDTLANYNIEIDKIKATVGPTVTLYEIIPRPGVRISKIKNLEDDIALSLAALGIRIIAPMPGKGTIGIEVPNSHPEMVSMHSVLATEKFQNTDMDLPIALGKTISNEVYIADLAKMPHLLVAGATGQGKSVGINAILTSLLFKKHPSELKFVLVDPKKVELSLFRKIERHFLAKLPDEEDAIITDTKKVINTLNSLCIEMDQRYDLLKNGSVRNLKEYNAKFVDRRLNPEEGHRFLPFIVLVVDEFADLMMTAGKEVEQPIARLAQLARAVGIHLVIATQRPSVNIITGTIKANFPARLAFRVLSKVDSRTILDSGGADQLIGRGDMLLSTGSDLIRIQCAFVDTPEVDLISEFIGEQRGYSSAFLLPEYIDESGEGSASSEFNFNERDALFEEAARLIVAHQQGSTSLIQRRMKLGYNRAGRIIDQLESVGIVGPFEGSKAREVLYADEYSLEQFLETLKKND